MKKERFVFIVPAYNPSVRMVKVVKELLDSGLEDVIIVDDGSSEDAGAVFEKVMALPESKERVLLLRHAVNMGKGAALKTAFNHILVSCPDVAGAVTLDCDGQHSVADCRNVLDVLRQEPEAFVLGYREFGKDIPFRSLIGNQVSRFVYRIILGYPFKDTQTGLRGVSRHFMRRSLKIVSNRFEFETEQLALAVQEEVKIVQIPIATIYIENNKSSSFRPLVDSFRIYFVLLRYGMASVVTALSDYLVFTLMIFAGNGVFFSNMVARTVSIGVQYTLLDKYVFFAEAGVKRFVLFALYVYITGVISSMAQLGLIHSAAFPVLGAKVLVEGVLFFLNFAFLRVFLFRKKRV